MLEACAVLLTLSTTFPVVPLPSPIDAPTGPELSIGETNIREQATKIGEVILNKVRWQTRREPAYEYLICDSHSKIRLQVKTRQRCASR